MKRLFSNTWFWLAVLIAAAVAVYLIVKHMVDQVNKEKVTAASADSNMNAFLDMIKMAEHGTTDPKVYHTLFGGGTFSDLSRHPNKCIDFRDTCSTAAGAYQVLYRTYKAVAARLGITDFSEHSQDLIAIELIREKGALNDVLAGRIEQAVYKIRKVWASLPGAGYNQPEKSVTQILTYYKNAGGVLAA